MTETIDIILLLTLIIPFLGIIINSMKLLFNREILDKVVSPVISIVLLLVQAILSIFVINEIDKGDIMYFMIDNLAVDWFSASIHIIVQMLFLIIGVYVLYYNHGKEYCNFFTLTFALQLGITLTIFSNHLFIMFLSWEFMVVAGYVLVVYNQTKRAYEAGIKYLVISSFGSLEILFGIGLLTSVVPSLSFDDLLEINSILDTFIGKLAFAFIIMGFGITAGMIFFNQWLPDAHPEAPVPVSGLLSGVVVKIGIYAIYRVFILLTNTTSYNGNIARLILIIAILTMTEGNLMVFAQFKRKDGTDYKRILAYSTTVHLGFLLLIVPINSEFTSIALLFHILNHGIAKVLLFLLSGYFITKIGSRNLNDLKGFGSEDKVIGISLFIGLMSLAGLPGTGGFISKLMILLSFYNCQIGNSIDVFMVVSLIVILLNTILAFVGYLWIIKRLIFDKPVEPRKPINSSRIDWIAKSCYILLSLAILGLGIFPNYFLTFII